MRRFSMTILLFLVLFPPMSSASDFSLGAVVSVPGLAGVNLEWTWEDVAVDVNAGWGIMPPVCPWAAVQARKYWRFELSAAFAGLGMEATYFYYSEGYGYTIDAIAPVGYEWGITEGFHLGFECDLMWVIYWRNNNFTEGNAEAYGRWAAVPAVYAKWDIR